MNLRRRRIASFASTGVGAGIAALVALGFARARTRRMNMKDRVVLVTGGSRGLGLEIARAFGREGARLVITARDESELERAREQLSKENVDVRAIPCDVSSPESVRALVETAHGWFGRIDVVVNDAGVIEVGPLEDQTKEDFAKGMDTHFWGPLTVALAVVPLMRARGEGRIVNIASVGGLVAIPHLLPYSASKFALVGLSQGLRSELSQDGIVVTTICPGLLRTGSARQATVKGQHEKEYAWFALGAAMPLLTWSAPRAARRIVRATKRGEARVTLGVPARVLALGNAVAPDLTASALALVAHLLPAPSGTAEGKVAKKGAEAESKLTRSPLLTLSRAAEIRENERRIPHI